MDLTFWVSATLEAIIVGLGKGGLPIMATLAVPSLSLVMSPIAAAGLLLPVYIVSDVFALFAYRRDYNPKVLKIAFIGMMLGVIIGAFTAHMIIEWVITFLIGCMGAKFALRMLFQHQVSLPEERVAIKVSQGIFWTTIAGFTSFISHNGGPQWQIFTLRLHLAKSVFVGTSVIAFSYVNFIKLFPYVWLGQIDYESTYVWLYLMLPASLAVFIGVKAVKVIPENLFYYFVTWALLLISVKLMFDGIHFGFW
jgi:uncharacterized membrane protein YfcA